MEGSQITVFSGILLYVVDSVTAWKDILIFFLYVSFFLILLWKDKQYHRYNNINLPTPAPASSLNEPHSQATCLGRGSAQTTKEIVADSPLLTDTVCPFSELVRNTSGAPVSFFYNIPMKCNELGKVWKKEEICTIP